MKIILKLSEIRDSVRKKPLPRVKIHKNKSQYTRKSKHGNKDTI